MTAPQERTSPMEIIREQHDRLDAARSAVLTCVRASLDTMDTRRAELAALLVCEERERKILAALMETFNFTQDCESA